MSFLMKYPVRNDLLPKGTKRRSGDKNLGVEFGLLHDTGNPDSTAQGNVNYYRNSANAQYASAQVFVDDKEIIICIPLTEKAWHVIYNVTTDNKIYGDDANDIAIGVELCYFPNDKARTLKAYEKYVWFNAWLAYNFKFNPKSGFVGHHIIDPQRKVDPMNALKVIGKSYQNLLDDIVKEYNECINQTVSPLDKGYLMEGDNGAEVGTLQTNLNKLGAQLVVDNDFGAATQRALIEFQQKNGLTVDGFYGSSSQKKMEQLITALSDITPISNPVSKPIVKPIIKEEEIELLEKAIVIGSLNDYPSAEILAIRLKAPIYVRGAIAGEVAKELILVGADPKGLKANKITNLSGASRFETADNVSKYLKK